MSVDKLIDYNSHRNTINNKLLDNDDKIIKRILNLDANAFKDGALDKKTKELLGLTASAVLRCDDCVKYHLQSCHELEITKVEGMEALSIATLVGGTVVIPYLRRAYEFWELLESSK